jgi:hypothetical protein
VIDKVEKTVLELTSVTEVVDWLLAQGATVSKKVLNESNLVLRDRINMEKQWQTTGRCIGNSDLHQAATEGKTECIWMFAGAKVDVIDGTKTTPLMNAISQKQNAAIAAMEVLLEKGADPNLDAGEFCVSRSHSNRTNAAFDKSQIELALVHINANGVTGSLWKPRPREMLLYTPFLTTCASFDCRSASESPKLTIEWQHLTT